MTTLVIFILGCLGLAAWLRKAWPVWNYMRHQRRLADVPPLAGAHPPPRVSVIVTACNEADTINRCLESLSAQHDAELRIIAVNDRSTDETGRLIDAAAQRDPRITPVHIRDLPDGWLGKNHACHVGSQHADGDWLLFTDGDIVFLPDCIHRAMDHARRENLHHLAMLPLLITDTRLEQAACCCFAGLLCSHCDAAHIRNPLRPKAHCGIGAFNLVQRDAYAGIGGHAAFPLDVGDDLRLGQTLKQHGFVSDLLLAVPHLQVRWQRGLRGFVRGLEKNAFRGPDFRVGVALYAVASLTLLALAPSIGTLFAPGWSRVPFVLAWVSEVALLGLVARRQRASWTLGFAWPIAALTLAYAIGRSMGLALWRGGIEWRGTFYPLAALRKGIA